MSNSTPVPPSPGPAHLSKLPKFLHRHQSRDRSRSLNEGPISSGSESSSSAASGPVAAVKNRSLAKKTSRLFGLKEKDERGKDAWRVSEGGGEDDDFGLVDSPIIIEPPSSPRESTEDSSFELMGNTSSTLVPHSFARPQRTRSDRPLSTSATMTSSDLSSFQHISVSPSTPRFTDIPSRLSGWFQNAFSTSTSDLSSLANQTPTPNSLSQSLPPSSSPSSRNKTPNMKSAAAIMAHIPGKANLEKAFRYFLDTDVAHPDYSMETIWVMGVEHPGFEPSTASLPSSIPIPVPRSRESTDSNIMTVPRRSTPPTYSRSTPPNAYHPNPSLQSLQANAQQLPAGQSLAVSSKYPPWPPAFFADYTSCIWLTYRSGYVHIKDITLAVLEPCNAPNLELTHTGPIPTVSESPAKPKWTWPVGGEKSWSSDTGWGCMLRTGQSLLANALIHLQLGREWRRPFAPSYTHDFATYVKILTWFLDNPSPLCPFSVHRMALAGKDLGKDVGSWFGPSTAAGAIKTLAHGFPAAEISVSVATDGVLFESEIYAMSNFDSSSSVPSSSSQGSSSSASPAKQKTPSKRQWGNRAVLVLIGVRLGIEGVNPIYHESVKALFTFPQSVGIAGGRPSSSYYFVGVQGDSLYYLDPHHTRATIPLRPPLSTLDSNGDETDSGGPGFRSASEDLHGTTGRSAWKNRTKQLRRQSTSASDSKSRPSRDIRQRTPTSPPPELNPRHSPVSPSPLSNSVSTRQLPTSTSIHSQLSSTGSTSSMANTVQGDPLLQHYCTAYTMPELNTFHCDKVRKMPVSSLDPSMLLGFLCRNEDDWKDFRARVDRLAKEHDAIFYIENEPSWRDDSDDDMGLESMSEPDTDHPSTMEDEFYDASQMSSPKVAQTESISGKTESIVDVEDESQMLTPAAKYPPDYKTPNLPVDDREEEDEWDNPSSSSSATRNSTSSVEPPRSNGREFPPIIRAPSPRTPPLPPSGQIAFPLAGEDDDEQSWQDAYPSRMMPIRARDGGRTESGGVKGVLYKAGEDDWRES